MTNLPVLIYLGTERERSDFALMIGYRIDAGLQNNAITIALHLSNRAWLTAVHTLLTVILFLLNGRQNVIVLGIELWQINHIFLVRSK